MNYKAICLICSFLMATEVQAAADFEVCGDLRQGEFIMLKKMPEKAQSILFDEREYPITKDGYAIIALGRDEKSKADLYLTAGDKAYGKLDFIVKQAVWDIQKINGVPQQKVTPDKSNDAEILREQKDVRRSLTVMQQGDFWRKGFIEPVKGRISGHFGNQRVFNGTPKSPHSGTDIAAPEGTPVKASGDGKVILSGKNYFYTGNMVIIDHGQGLQTIYAHLKEAKVKEGDNVKQGDIIGLVGKTGRATGPHLHWGASLNNVRFRPHSLLNIKNKTCRSFSAKEYTGE